ncbi:MAG TPA: hypothetical protein VMX33_13070 [bacterium]|nr:hypothetical protein [bacterium]
MVGTSDVEEFLKVFRPRRDAYVQKDKAGNLQTIYHPLSDAVIDRHMRGVSGRVISFFSTEERRNYLGVDIDDHVMGGWVGSSPTHELEEKYRAVVGEIGKAPSAAFASQRGIHAFWFLDRRVPNEVIVVALKERLEVKLEVEILPRPREAVSIPRPDEYIDINLARTGFPGYAALPRYPALEVLGEEARPEKIRARLKATKKLSTAPTRGKDPMKNIEEAETRVLPLENNATNEVYCRMVGIYKANGLSVDQAFERFRDLVMRSPGYSGALLLRLQDRIEASYRSMRGTTALDMESLAVLRREPIVAMALEFAAEAARLERQTRSRMAFEEFLLNIIAWKRSLDRIFADRERATFWEYLYPGSRRFHREGYYPLSYGILKQWNSHYDRWMELLKGLGILVESPYGYSSTGHRSKHYTFQLLSCRIEHGPTSGRTGSRE